MSFDERISELLVHGVLHLFGYDHEDDADSARRMHQKSSDLLARIRDVGPF
jgi:probable rRNA maturation factor